MGRLEDMPLGALLGGADDSRAAFAAEMQSWSMPGLTESRQSDEFNPAAPQVARHTRSRAHALVSSDASNQAQDSNSSVSFAMDDSGAVPRPRRSSRRSQPGTPMLPETSSAFQGVPTQREDRFVTPQPPLASSSTEYSDLDWQNFILALNGNADLPEDEADADYNFEEDQMKNPYGDDEAPTSAIPRREIFDIQNEAHTPTSFVSDSGDYSASDQLLSDPNTPSTPQEATFSYPKRRKIGQFAGSQDVAPLLPDGAELHVEPTPSIGSAEGAAAAAAAIAAIAPMASLGSPLLSQRRRDLVVVPPWDLLIDQLQTIQQGTTSGLGSSGRPDAASEARQLHEQLAKMKKQMEQHFQLLVQVNLISRSTANGIRAAESSWQLLAELAGFFNKSKAAEEARNTAISEGHEVPAVFPSNVLFDIAGFHLLEQFQGIVPADLDPSRMSPEIIFQGTQLFQKYFQEDLGIVETSQTLIRGGVKSSYKIIPLTNATSADKKIRWTPSEDLLLVLGLHRYGYDWDAIVANYLPTKEVSQVKNRFKNRKKLPQPNPVKMFWQRDLMPATHEEKVQLVQDLAIYMNDFDSIARESMRHRSAAFLRKVWENELQPMLKALELQKQIAQVLVPHRFESFPTLPLNSAPEQSIPPMAAPFLPQEPVERHSLLPPSEESLAISELFVESPIPQPATPGPRLPAVSSSSAVPQPQTPVETAAPAIPEAVIKQALAAALADSNLLHSVLRDSGFSLVVSPLQTSTPKPPVELPGSSPAAPAIPPSPAVPATPAAPQLIAPLRNVVDMPDGSRAVFSREEDKEILVALKKFRGNIPSTQFLSIAQAVNFSKTPIQMELRARQLLAALAKPK